MYSSLLVLVPTLLSYHTESDSDSESVTVTAAFSGLLSVGHSGRHTVPHTVCHLPTSTVGPKVQPATQTDTETSMPESRTHGVTHAVSRWRPVESESLAFRSSWRPGKFKVWNRRIKKCLIRIPKCICFNAPQRVYE